VFHAGLNGRVYAPALWEKWLHATYLGRVYYWLEGLSVATIHFEKKSRRYRAPNRGPDLQLLEGDFDAGERQADRCGDILVPACRIFRDNRKHWWSPGRRQYS
jgi:hypothetical protein